MAKKGAVTASTNGHNGSCTIRACSCKNAYQDGKYGTGQRVHNPTNKGPRCTVCGVVRA